jgi:hypothetical protein
MKSTADVTGGKLIAVLLQSISGANPLVTFYDIHGGKRDVLLFCPGHHTRLIAWCIPVHSHGAAGLRWCPARQSPPV